MLLNTRKIKELLPRAHIPILLEMEIANRSLQKSRIMATAALKVARVYIQPLEVDLFQFL